MSKHGQGVFVFTVYCSLFTIHSGSGGDNGIPLRDAPRGVLLLNEDEVRRLLTMDLALEAVEQGLRKMALDEAHVIPRAPRRHRPRYACT